MTVTRKIPLLLAVVAALAFGPAFGPAFAADLGTATTGNMEKMGNGHQSKSKVAAKKAPRKK